MESAVIESSLVSSNANAVVVFTGSTKTEKVRSSPVSAQSNESVQLVPHFKQFLAFLIFDIPQVRKVLIREQGRVMQVYVVVDQYDLSVNEIIYDREEHIIDVFASIDFDFHITSQSSLSDPDLELISSR